MTQGTEGDNNRVVDLIGRKGKERGFKIRAQRRRSNYHSRGQGRQQSNMVEEKFEVTLRFQDIRGKK